MLWSGIAIAVAALWTSTGPDPVHWQWPLRPTPQILRTFDPPAHPWEAGHRGVDLAARPGQPVYATGPGRVTYAHDLAGRGVITITHGTLRTTYLPVTPAVRPGQTVRAGTAIGRLESTLGHCGQSPCLHWGLLKADTYLDPLSLLGLAPVRLLPWWPALLNGGLGAR
jgi:murein DD-endopeptidase MepM/ murein hydrolase activator NlpD